MDAGAKPRGPDWPALVALGVLAVTAHVWMEWLFFATKPSFLSPLPARVRWLLPGVVALPLAASLVALLLLLAAIARLGRGGRPSALCGWLGLIAVAAVPAATSLLLIDNFTVTVLGVGLAALGGLALAAYRLVFVVLLLAWLPRLRRWQAARRGPRWTLLGGAATALAFAVLAFVLEGDGAAAGASPGVQPRRPLPDVVIIGSDGVEASRLSVYGYPRPTSPVLDRLASEALVCENAFPNASATGASVVSILTSRLPTETGVVYPPDVVRGHFVGRHLPAILREAGYATAQFTIRWYADAIDLNLRQGFQVVNFRTADDPEDEWWAGLIGPEAAYFLDVMLERAGVRLVGGHRQDAFREVTDGSLVPFHDDERMRGLLAFLTRASAPRFVHVHLMGTHGPKFAERGQLFSRGQTQDAAFKTDFYDDALREFDRRVADLLDALAGAGRLDSTVIVIYSDHGIRYRTDARVPLLIRFPRGEHAGRVGEIAQNLDIAPTLLDYLGIEPPDWMHGRSLLSPRRDPCRPVWSVTHNARDVRHRGDWWYGVPRPPFFTLASVRVLVGGRQTQLDLASGSLTESRVALAGAPPACAAVDPSEQRRAIVGHLAEAGYDVSTLAGAAPATPAR
jgi:hypothetical protein